LGRHPECCDVETPRIFREGRDAMGRFAALFRNSRIDMPGMHQSFEL
jgi:hypothetical protein